MAQAGFHSQYTPGPPDPQHWHGHAHGPSIPYVGEEYSETVYELLPSHHDLFERGDGFGHLALGDTLARSWIQIDYLLWDLQAPGNVLLGAGTLTGDPREGVNAVDRVLGARPNTIAVVPDLDSSNYDDLNGIRGSFGIPTRVGTLETEAWVLQQGSETINQPPVVDTLNGTTTIAATTLLRDGAPANGLMILYSDSYRATLDSSLFGTEGNWVMNPVTPNTRVRIRPLVGFRYLRFYEELSMAGTDEPDPILAPGVTLDHRIDSETKNHVFGPQFGFRAETEVGRLTLSFEPKFFVGINRYKATVATSQLFSPTEDPTFEKNEHTRFAPTFDLGLAARFHVTQNFSVHVGYDLFVTGNISRPFDHIYYNAPGSVTEPPDVSLAEDTQSFFAHGLTVGGQILFR